MLKLIKEAQTLNAIGDKIDLYKEVQSIIKGSTLDTVANILHENEDFGITPQQIHDQVHQHLAPAAGKSPQSLTQSQFNTLANQFRIELEDDYDELYPASQWKRLVNNAWGIHTALVAKHQENEESAQHPYQAGWDAQCGGQGRDACPHRMGHPNHNEWHEGYGDANSAKYEENEEHGWPSETDDDDDMYGEPNADGSYSQRYDAMPQARGDNNFFGDDQENEETHRASRRKPASSPEHEGWVDAQMNKQMASQDPEYVKGYELWQRTGHKSRTSREENEENTKPTMLQSLLQQKKAAAKKANSAVKDAETAGAKAFHEHRMASAKSPYDAKKQASDHDTWMRGWNKAAAEHYAPQVVDVKMKKKNK